MIKEEGRFRYIETGGSGTPIVCCTDIVGSSNFEGIISHFSPTHNLVVPILPLFEISLRSLSVTKLVEYVDEFIQFKGFSKVHVLGNSLGCYIAQLYTLKNAEKVESMTLTGSSGLFESAMDLLFLSVAIMNI